MNEMRGKLNSLIFFVLFCSLLLLAGCGPVQIPAEPTILPRATATVEVDLPVILSAAADRAEVPRYESVEFTLEIEAQFSNPYDARSISLDAVFTSPDGKEMPIPGFWDGEGSWKLRFTPSQEGLWTYSILVRDARGNSLPHLGELAVTPSDLHGWIQPGHLLPTADVILCTMTERRFTVSGIVRHSIS